MGSQVELFAEDYIFPEGLKWRGDRLWLSDVFDNKVYSVDATGERRLVCEVPNRPSGLGFLPDGSLLIVSSKDRRLLRHRDGLTMEYANLSTLAKSDVNDFAVDPRGRAFVGNFGYDYDAGEPRCTTSLHRVDPDGTIATVAEDVEFPNGSVVINGGTTLIVAETWKGRVLAFDIALDGSLSGRRVFADLGGRQPDGITADAEGALWVASFGTGEFLRVLDGGRITHTISFEGRGVCCALGGANGDQLFMSVFRGPVEEIASLRRRGALFRTRVDVPALR